MPRTDYPVLDGNGNVIIQNPYDPALPYLNRGGGGLVLPTDMYVRIDGTVARALPNMARGSGWGSSSAAGIISYLNAALANLGVTIYKGGKGSERAEHIFARLGSRPALLTFPGNSIPASGAVNVTSSNMPALALMLPFVGVVGGVQGTLSCPNNNTITFTRTASGGDVPVAPDATFVPVIGPQYRGDMAFLWAGKNNFSPTQSGREILVIQATDQAFDWFSYQMKRILVLGHFADTGTPAVSMERDQILATNAAHAARYGDLFVDVYGYLTGAQVWIDTGITPTSGDLAEQALGNKPPSLSADTQHLNPAGYTAVAALFRARMMALGWYKEPVA